MQWYEVIEKWFHFWTCRVVAQRVRLCPVNVLIFRADFIWFHSLFFFFFFSTTSCHWCAATFMSRNSPRMLNVVNSNLKGNWQWGFAARLGGSFKVKNGIYFHGSGTQGASLDQANSFWQGQARVQEKVREINKQRSETPGDEMWERYQKMLSLY